MSATEQNSAPVDLEAMRKSVRAVLLPDGGSPIELEAEDAAMAVIEELRSHLERLIPDVESRADKASGSIARYCTLACVGEARGKLRAQPLPRPGGPLGYARRLARVLTALCDHHERMGGESK
ncbi:MULTISPECIES: DUF6415 family natural product biosynthesis protein [Streptomyces]|nr:DUF6415 family natural product biosynthesis protein [Streptomyces parvulus]MZD53933.1 hypothetical protein [Streptomyces sp. SID5606]